MPAILPPPAGTPHPDIASERAAGRSQRCFRPPQPVPPLAGPADAPMLPGPPVLGGPVVPGACRMALARRWPAMPPGYAPHARRCHRSAEHAHGAPRRPAAGRVPDGQRATPLTPGAPEPGSGQRRRIRSEPAFGARRAAEPESLPGPVRGRGPFRFGPVRQRGSRSTIAGAGSLSQSRTQRRIDPGVGHRRSRSFRSTVQPAGEVLLQAPTRATPSS